VRLLPKRHRIESRSGHGRRLVETWVEWLGKRYRWKAWKYPKAITGEEFSEMIRSAWKLGCALNLATKHADDFSQRWEAIEEASRSPLLDLLPKDEKP
jgi:hypothetical protein